ncbi:cupin-like domain-containing protein [Tricharina praecox]|uniref:cupin-like domain-containing protein n=1 Tax=Tricharina praecox TaxID=43433 RepID=UPI00221E8EEB|nr:cupin-like domain-containing protein [Tricharina praecox]KAI5848980.1 cupin-like domain-containing protein [Tricharina praecox]
MSALTATASLIEVLSAYHELNSSGVEERSGEPTPLEFSRGVRQNFPVVFRGAVSHWKAVTNWRAAYLRDTMGSESIAVAETPLGNADSAVVREEDGKRYFVKPHERQMPFGEFLDDLQAKVTSESESAMVRYAQSQDDNLLREFAPLAADVGRDIPWASEALGQQPDAANVWIGNERSVSALHKDNYENLFCQISGYKRFVLISPYEAICVRETSLQAATYVPNPHTQRLAIVPDEPASEVLFWPTVDPDSPPGTAWWRYCRPMEVELAPGDVLYLPAMWYHKVSQRGSDEGLCCAVNYWYDMEFGGAFYPGVSFARQMTQMAQQEEEEEEEEEEAEMWRTQAW